MTKIYLAGPLFSQAERIWNRRLEQLLVETYGFTVFLPQDFKLEGRFPAKPHYGSLFREYLTYMMENPRNIGACTTLLFVAKNVERIGDHITNIAETIYFRVKAKPLKDSLPEGIAGDEYEEDDNR